MKNKISIPVDDIDKTVYIIVDTETTIRGHDKELLSDYENPRLCELAFSVIKDGEFSTKTLFCDPEMPMPTIASATNGIRDKDVEGAPSYHDVKTRFKDFVSKYLEQDCNVYLVAHNAQYDAKVLDLDLDSYPWICTYRMSKLLYPYAEKHTNSYLRHMLNVDDEVEELPRIAHRALDDALITQANLNHMIHDLRRKMADKIGVESSEVCLSSNDVEDFSNSPIEVKKMPFGPHKGKIIDGMISPDEIKYIVRMLNKDFMDDDLKATLFHHLGSNTHGLDQNIIDLFIGDNTKDCSDPMPMSILL